MMRTCSWMAGLVLLWFAAVSGCSHAPQMGGDKDCMTAADALWTAVNLKESDLLDRAAGEIEQLHSTGKMPEAAFVSLSSIVATARTGQWPEARNALHKFIRDQRPARH